MTTQRRRPRRRRRAGSTRRAMSRPGGGGTSTFTRSPASRAVAGAARALPFTVTWPLAISVAACVRESVERARDEQVEPRRPRRASTTSRGGPVPAPPRRRAVRGHAVTRSCVGARGARSRARRARGCVLVRQSSSTRHTAPHAHRGVGDVERPEAHVADADVDEVHDALAVANAVEQVADRAADHGGDADARARARAPASAVHAQDDARRSRTLSATKIQRDASPRCMPNAAPGL